jgi:hypothetical protein
LAGDHQVPVTRGVAGPCERVAAWARCRRAERISAWPLVVLGTIVGLIAGSWCAWASVAAVIVGVLLFDYRLWRRGLPPQGDGGS